MIGFLSETAQTVKQAKRQDIFIFFAVFVVAITFIFASFFLIDAISQEVRDITGTKVASLAETLRNAAWVLWVGLTIASLIVGFGILNRGQQQKREGLDQESFATNLKMLASNSTMLRIAGIRWLQKLIKDDFNAGQMYFEAFVEYIRNPYMGRGEEDNLDKKFPANKPLPSDIQGAAEGLFMIVESFQNNESIKKKKKKITLPADLWRKSNFFQSFVAAKDKVSNRNLTVEAMRKGINKAIIDYYQEKSRDCNLCKLLYLLYFSWNFSFLLLLISIFFVFFIFLVLDIGIIFKDFVLFIENTYVYKVALKFINWSEVLPYSQVFLLGIFTFLSIAFFVHLCKSSYASLFASYGLSNKCEGLLSIALEKIESGKYAVVHFFSSPIRRIILRTRKEMKNSVFVVEHQTGTNDYDIDQSYCYVSEYTWRKEKDVFYKDIQKRIEYAFASQIESNDGIRKINTEELFPEIHSVFHYAGQELYAKDKKNTSLKITLPRYFWKNKIREAVKFPSANLQGNDMEEAHLKEANLMKANLQGVNMKGANLQSARLMDANLQWAEMQGANLQRAKMQGTNLQGVNMRKASLLQANLMGADFESIEGANLYKAFLQLANLAGANLGNAQLYKTDFGQANLESANLSHAKIYKADFNRANLANIIMVFGAYNDGCKAIFWRANLYRANMFQLTNHLQGCDFTGANLEKAQFCHPDDPVGPMYTDDNGNEEPSFPHTQLHDVKFDGANLSGAVMNLTTGLTKEQILSATWGINRAGEGEPPILPEKLKNGKGEINTKEDKEIQEWLEKPHYDLSKLSKEEWEQEYLTEGFQMVGGRTWPTHFEKKTGTPAE